MTLDISRFLERFIDEAQDLLSRLGTSLERLSEQQDNAELVQEMFRTVHTLKGSSRMLNLSPIADTAHALEELLVALRDGQVDMNPAVEDLFFQSLDWLAGTVELLAVERKLDAVVVPTELRQRLLIMAGQEQSEAPSAIQPMHDVDAQLVSLHNTVRLKLDTLDSLAKLISEMESNYTGLRELVRDARQIKKSWDSISDRQRRGLEFERLFHRLKEIEQSQQGLVYSLHEQALELRMLPIKHVFEPVARHVREMGRSLGKKVSAHIKGEGIELDRFIIEQLSEPLVHLLRNAVDHGIEDAARRLAAGKPEIGQITLSASRDAGRVVIELSDDGAGLNLEAIREKLLSKAELMPSEVEEMTEHELTQQIFAPGFTTSRMITDVSGRGVGLDVVRRDIEGRLQGSLEVVSEQGMGTVFRMRLPVSLSVLRVLLVNSSGKVFGFVAQHVVELTRIDKQQILEVAGRNVFVWRNEFVPIFALDVLTGVPLQSNRSERADELVVIVAANNQKIALIIDDMEDELDLVIRSLPAHLSHNRLVSGVVKYGYQQLVSLLHVPQLLLLTKEQYKAPTDIGARLAPRHVLVVDDSFNTREIEKDVLEAWGYQVTLAEDGLDGLHKARYGNFDAVITDVEMPYMDGFTLTSHLREDERYKNRPIIIITSREKESDRRRGIEVGADAYIVKGSFDQNNLVDTLKALLG